MQVDWTKCFLDNWIKAVLESGFYFTGIDRIDSGPSPANLGKADGKAITIHNFGKLR
jgi:hypothetical protein